MWMQLKRLFTREDPVASTEGDNSWPPPSYQWSSLDVFKCSVIMNRTNKKQQVTENWTNYLLVSKNSWVSWPASCFIVTINICAVLATHPPIPAYRWSFIWWFICVLLTSINCGIFLALNDLFKENSFSWQQKRVKNNTDLDFTCSSLSKWWQDMAMAV